jgi:hypothetical protein
MVSSLNTSTEEGKKERDRKGIWRVIQIKHNFILNAILYSWEKLINKTQKRKTFGHPILLSFLRTIRDPGSIFLEIIHWKLLRFFFY